MPRDARREHVRRDAASTVLLHADRDGQTTLQKRSGRDRLDGDELLRYGKFFLTPTVHTCMCMCAVCACIHYTCTVIRIYIYIHTLYNPLCLLILKVHTACVSIDKVWVITGSENTRIPLVSCYSTFDSHMLCMYHDT